MKAFDLNCDGLIGPTYNFAGLSEGNLASMDHRGRVSHPRRAALQGLQKMKMLADLGLKQAVLPPHERPDIHTLREVGFHGTDAQVLEKAFAEAPELARACCAASAAWAANGATATPSSDTADGSVHFTPANLASRFHRSLEPIVTGSALICLAPDPEAFVHHAPLPAHPSFGDEGAANQMRLCNNLGEPGVQVFVYGRVAFGRGPEPSRFPARQTFEASRALARRHRLDRDRTLFVQQNPELIDAGVFHNDLAAVANRNVLIYHEKAFLESEKFLEELSHKIDLVAIRVTEQELPISDLVSTYLLNSQLISLPNDQMVLISPLGCKENPRTRELIERWIAASDNPIEKVLYFDLSESMRNGGGPACLRLPLVVTESEYRALHRPLLLDDITYRNLVDWINDFYREELRPDDLADPDLLIESREALDVLTELLDLGPLYPFQQG
jgi:succinylarginine dihydrolase